MYQIDIKQFKEVIKYHTEKISFLFDDKKYQVGISRQKTGFGEKSFMVCPGCGKRFTKLYIINKRIKCRNCGKVNPYWGIQNTTKGGYTEIEYRMEKIARKNKITFKYPFDYLDLAFDERIKNKDFIKVIRTLQILENMRNQSIFFNRTYEPKTITSVMNEDHPNFNKYELRDLKDYFYAW